jgi:Uma2 family endonuclease
VAETSLARDRVKARLYAAAAVTEYWIVNLAEQVVEVHRQPGAEGYAAVSRHDRTHSAESRGPRVTVVEPTSTAVRAGR